MTALAETFEPTFPTTLDFLAWEECQPHRYEYIGGRARMMTGGTRRHNAVARNVLSRLDDKLAQHRCQPFGSDQMVRVALGLVVYPDAVIDCGGPTDNAQAAERPTVVFEVLSPSTRHSDFKEKLPAYQATPTLTDIVYIEPDLVQVYHWTRQADSAVAKPQWHVSQYFSMEDRVTLFDAAITLSLAEIYRRVTF